MEDDGRLCFVELNGVQLPKGTYPAVQRTVAQVRDPARKVLKPIVVIVKIDGHPCQALIDSGSMGDFVSTTLVQQLKLKKTELATPLPLQMACQGSRSRINHSVTTKFEYQKISGNRQFDVANLHGHDIILGTPFLFQHKITFGFNPSQVIVGSADPVPIQGPAVSEIASRTCYNFSYPEP